MLKQKSRAFIEILVIIILFILSSYIIQTNIEFFEYFMNNKLLGMAVYLIITIIAIVIAPVSTMALLPLAANLWGTVITAILSIVGWTIGSLIAFVLARKYGVPLVKKFVSLEKINKIEKMIPKKNLFWSIVFLRITIPVDILSYALGLFSKIKTLPYLLATIIGTIPFAFIYSYLGKMPFYYQIMAVILAGIVILIGILIRKK